MQAQEIKAQDTIIVNLSASQDGNGINLAFTFSGEGTQLAPNPYGPALNIPRAAVGAVPLFPMDEYTAAVRANGGAEHAKVTAIVDRYQAQLRASRGAGNKPLADLLVDSVFDFITKNTEVKAGGDRWNLQKNQVLVRVPERFGENPCIFTVQPQPVWGTR